MESNDIGLKIKKLRRDKGLTQKDFAKQLSVADSTISNWETGRRLPSIAELRRVAELLDVSLGYFEFAGANMTEHPQHAEQTEPFQKISHQPLGFVLGFPFVLILVVSILLLLVSFLSSGLLTIFVWAVALFGVLWVSASYIIKSVLHTRTNYQVTYLPTNCTVTYIHVSTEKKVQALRHRLIYISIFSLILYLVYYVWLLIVVSFLGSWLWIMIASLYGVFALFIVMQRHKTLIQNAALTKKVDYHQSFKSLSLITLDVTLLIDLVSLLLYSLLVGIAFVNRPPLEYFFLLGIGVILAFASCYILAAYKHHVRLYSLYAIDCDNTSRKKLS